MTTNFNLTSGKNRALVCYISTGLAIDAIFAFQKVSEIFDDANIDIDTASTFTSIPLSQPQSALNIALQWADTSRSLKVGGSFSDVCVGVYFYDQPIPPEPEIVFVPVDELGNSIGEPEYEEPEPAPSITELVCDALRETFGGVYGASAFVVPSEVTEFTLEVE